MPTGDATRSPAPLGQKGVAEHPFESRRPGAVPRNPPIPGHP